MLEVATLAPTYEDALKMSGDIAHTKMLEATNAKRAFGVDLAMNCATTNAFSP